MKTKIIKVTEEIEYRKIINEIGTILKSGGVVAFPTETVYGLGANALDEDAARKIYEAKGRPSDNPLIIHIAQPNDVDMIAQDISIEAKQMMEQFWPGPLTLVLPKKDCVPDGTTGGLSTVAVRMPSHKLARDVISAGGGYIAAPSANVSGRPSPTRGAHVVEDMDGRIDAILIKDNVEIGVESTIVDCTTTPPMILRPGAITKGMLEGIIGQVQVDKTLLEADSKEAPKAPGMKYRHYAPKGEMVLVDGEVKARVEYIIGHATEKLKKGEKVAIIALGRSLQEYQGPTMSELHQMYQGKIQVHNLGDDLQPAEAAKNMYKLLRHMDTQEVDYIYCEQVPSHDVWAAVSNRLNKAAGNKIITV